MNTIEKMARKELEGSDFDAGEFHCFLIGFFKGFHKAREMAADTLSKDYWCSTCGADEKSIRQMGEEEAHDLQE